ncbi:type I-E CRISPR-associated protein Cse1/CasA [Streptomyces sp. NPDC058279]|uniref:type I-E CRISPR-associated protein Cse1/CasA n=1 Tax=Streptomyces sp. NPDC058279 TaxID=3346418 RepID=UPI0036E37C58
MADSMADGFDLRDEPWIPVRLGSGASVMVGLRELFHRAHEIEDLELPVPPVASGLLRLLAAVTARIKVHDGIALDDEDLADEPPEWVRVRNRVLRQKAFDADAVDEYLDCRVSQGRFDLFHPERPFMQDPRLRTECVDGKGLPNPSGVNKLVLGRPTGVNGAVLFGHFTDTAPLPVPAAEAAWHLIAQLYYGPSGQCTPRRITTVKPGNGDAGPLRKSLSYHPWADSLYTTLILSVPAPTVGEPDPFDACPWEEESLPDPLGAVPSPSWPGRLLTGRIRHAALLVPSPDGKSITDAYLTWSTHEPAVPAPDPYVILDMPRAGDGEPYPRPADAGRALWRDLDALLLKGGGQARRPAVFENLPASLRAGLRVRAYGFDQDGQQKDSSWFEATTPPVLGWQEDGSSPEMAVRVGQSREFAEQTGDRLRYAALLAWKIATDPGVDPAGKVKLDRKKPGPWAQAALAHYWPSAEKVFWSLLAPGRLDDPVRPAFVEAALDALDAAIGARSADVRVARARVNARRVLRSLLRQTTIPQQSSGTLSGSER